MGNARELTVGIGALAIGLALGFLPGSAVGSPAGNERGAPPQTDAVGGLDDVAVSHEPESHRSCQGVAVWNKTSG